MGKIFKKFSENFQKIFRKFSKNFKSVFCSSVQIKKRKGNCERVEVLAHNMKGGKIGFLAIPLKK